MQRAAAVWLEALSAGPERGINRQAGGELEGGGWLIRGCAKSGCRSPVEPRVAALVRGESI